ncbi:MAG: hypothetical protein QM756_31440 [Polyangiaceae bacterium]
MIGECRGWAQRAYYLRGGGLGDFACHGLALGGPVRPTGGPEQDRRSEGYPNYRPHG